MSAGNLSACIGLANTNKILRIGPYVQDALIIGRPGPGCDGEAIGVNGLGFWNYNFMGELVDGTTIAPANSGVAAGKTAVWCITNAGLAASTTRVDVTAGVAVANNATGLYDVNTGQGNPAVPVGSYLWAFLR